MALCAVEVDSRGSPTKSDPFSCINVTIVGYGLGLR